MSFEFITSIPDWDAFACSCYNLAIIYFLWDLFKFVFTQIPKMFRWFKVDMKGRD